MCRLAELLSLHFLLALLYAKLTHPSCASHACAQASASATFKSSGPWFSNLMAKPLIGPWYLFAKQCNTVDVVLLVMVVVVAVALVLVVLHSPFKSVSTASTFAVWMPPMLTTPNVSKAASKAKYSSQVARPCTPRLMTTKATDSLAMLDTAKFSMLTSKGNTLSNKDAKSAKNLAWSGAENVS